MEKQIRDLIVVMPFSAKERSLEKIALKIKRKDRPTLQLKQLRHDLLLASYKDIIITEVKADAESETE